MLNARSTGVLNAVGAMSVVAMPFTFPAMATLMALTMSEVVEVDEPVHWGFGMPRIDAASCSPYWVAVKKVLVVTWLTNVNL